MKTLEIKRKNETVSFNSLKNGSYFLEKYEDIDHIYVKISEDLAVDLANPSYPFDANDFKADILVPITIESITYSRN